MAKSIKLSLDEWINIRKVLKEEYQWKPSVMAIRTVMKRELGFTIRFHTEWNTSDTLKYQFNMQREDCVYLDFYDDAKETMFRLKYL